jgi:hypothetical protein
MLQLQEISLRFSNAPTVRQAHLNFKLTTQDLNYHNSMEHDVIINEQEKRPIRISD